MNNSVHSRIWKTEPFAGFLNLAKETLVANLNLEE